MNFLNMKKSSWRCCTVFFVFLAVLCVQSIVAQSIKSEKITIQVKNQPVEKAFTEISRQTGLKFFYGETVVSNKLAIHLSFDDMPIQTVLDAITKQTKLYFSRENNTISVSTHKNTTSLSTGVAHSRKIAGIITDDRGEPIIGANIVMKGTTTGTITDLNGNFSLEVSDNASLIISYIGYTDKTVSVGSSPVLNVSLSEDTQKLEEVIVVGYGTMKKSDLTGSVSSLDSESIILGFSQSPDVALKGKTAGVQITTTSGQPGAGATVRIRGNSSILGSNDPLYVVDGVPLDGGSAADGIKGVSVSPLTIINPSDIESMEILKDASATAIYGSRGANGVVMITTKRGKEGVFNAQINIFAGFQNLINPIELTTPEEYMEMWNESMDYRNNGNGKYDVNKLPGRTDWMNECFRAASFQNYELLFNGGTKNLTYMISGGFASQDGIVMNTDFKRYSLRTNLENKFTNWLKIGLNLSATRTEGNQAGQGSMEVNTPIGMLTTASPLEPIYNEDGSYNMYVDTRNKDINPYASLKELLNKDMRNRFVSNVYAEINLMKGLSLRTNFATDVTDAKSNYYAPSFVAEGNSSRGMANIGAYNSIYWNSTNTLSFERVFDEIHSINAMFGAEWQTKTTEGNFVSASGFANDNAGVYNISEATNFSASSDYNGWQMRSYFTRINYVLINKYSFTLTGRLDGSSRFGMNNRNAFFPAAAFAWRINEEPFMKQFEYLSNLKLRASYGVSGEQGIPVYQTLSILNSNSVFVDKNLYVGYVPGRAPNPSLKWEKTNQVNVGVDVGLWNGMLNFIVDIYYKRTNDLLYYKALPTSSGYNSILSNIGSVENKGLEFTIDATPVQTKGFSWNINVNNSVNRNKLLELGDGRTEVLNPSGGVKGGDNKMEPSILRVGKPLGILYGYISDGVIYDEAESVIAKEMGQIQYAPGELKIMDVNKDGRITTEDRTIIADSNPVFTGGMTNTISYKGFDLSVLCSWVVGNDIMCYQHMVNQRMDVGYNMTKDWYNNRWTAQNPNRLEPRAGYDVRAYSDVSYHVFDGSFFKINNITLSYSLNKSFISKIGLKSCRLSLSMDNVHTFTDYPGWSPELSAIGGNVMAQGIDLSTYPIPRTFSFGLNIGF